MTVKGAIWRTLFKIISRLVGLLESNVPFQHKYGYIRDERWSQNHYTKCLICQYQTQPRKLQYSICFSNKRRRRERTVCSPLEHNWPGTSSHDHSHVWDFLQIHWESSEVVGPSRWLLWFHAWLLVENALYTVSQKKVPTFKLSVVLLNINRLSKFCTARKRMKFATKLVTLLASP